MANNVLVMLREEQKVHCFYFMDLAFLEGNYELKEEGEKRTADPDMYISSLASDLLHFEGLMAEFLPFSRYQ